MRIAVIGAGALGGTFAALLVQAGHDVTVLARAASLEVIAAEGIRLTGGFGTVHARPRALPQLTEAPELTLLCTKAQDAAAALTENAALLDGTPVIVVQNGLDGVTAAVRLLPHSECFGALSIIAAHYLAPGQVNVTTAAPTYLGRGAGAADSQARHWQGILTAAVPTFAIDNFVGAQWTKLVVNMLNSLPAITGRSVQDTVSHAGLRRLLTRSMRETVRVGLARGVRFAALQGLSDWRLRLFARAPTWAGQLLPWLFVRRMGAVPNLGSTQQSLVRGQLTEIDYLNGAVVREARAAGLTVPVNELLTALVHERESGAPAMTPTAVLARFRSLSVRS